MRALALGILATAGIALAIPANAQGVSVGVVEHHDHDRDHRRIIVGEGHHHCRTVIIHEHGITKKIRRCG